MSHRDPTARAAYNQAYAQANKARLADAQRARRAAMTPEQKAEKKAKRAAYVVANRERIRATHAAWMAEHGGHIPDWMRQYRIDNADALAAQQHAYRTANKDAIAQRAKDRALEHEQREAIERQARMARRAGR